MTTLHQDTLALHAGYDPKDHHNCGTAPIYQTSAYTFDDPDQAARLFKLEEFGNIYARITNPTNALLEQRIAALEGGTGALAVSSGQAAQFIAITNIAKSGDNFLAANQLYGGTFSQFKNAFGKIGIAPRFFDLENDIGRLEEFVDEKTRCIFVESIANPGLNIPDFEALAKKAEELHLPIIVDNTFATPFLFKPLKHGAHVVVHSATKFIGGNAVGIGGIIVEGGNFDWAKDGKYPEITEESQTYAGVNFWERFGPNCPVGNIAYIIKARAEGLRDFGPALSPFNAWLFLQGIQSLHLRIERHCENAEKLAKYLESHPAVERVIYPSLDSSEQKQRADKYLGGKGGGVLGAELKGGAEAGKKLLTKVKVASFQTNLGDSRTIVVHNASTTHSRLNAEELVKAGVTPGYLRIAVGLEHIDDLIADFEQALA